MDYLLGFLNVVIVILTLFLIVLILIQRGKGGGLAGAFGGMGGSSAFGARTGDVFTKVTVGVAIAWILLSMLMVVLTNRKPRSDWNDPAERGRRRTPAPRRGDSKTKSKDRSGVATPRAAGCARQRASGRHESALRASRSARPTDRSAQEVTDDAFCRQPRRSRGPSASASASSRPSTNLARPIEISPTRLCEAALLLSMTGFGEARLQNPRWTIVVEVRTVNNRHFKLSAKISEAHAMIEPALEQLVREKVRRGTVQVNLRIERPRRPEDYRLEPDGPGQLSRSAQEPARF